MNSVHTRLGSVTNLLYNGSCITCGVIVIRMYDGKIYQGGDPGKRGWIGSCLQMISEVVERIN